MRVYVVEFISITTERLVRIVIAAYLFIGQKLSPMLIQNYILLCAESKPENPRSNYLGN